MTTFSNNCNPSSVQYSTLTKLVKITNLQGKNTKILNTPLIYFYSDGTVEKKIFIHIMKV